MALEISGAHLGLHSPLATSASANAYWGTDAAFRYGDVTILQSTSGVFDTGTTLLGLATGKLLRDS
jgi:hypothetical protein